MAVQYVAMHMSDGIVDAPTSLGFAVIALRPWRRRLAGAPRPRRTRLPLAGLVAAFIFAVQMVNFPILPGSAAICSAVRLPRSWSDPHRCRGALRSSSSCSRCCSPTAASRHWVPNITNMAVIGVGGRLRHSSAAVLDREPSPRERADRCSGCCCIRIGSGWHRMCRNGFRTRIRGRRSRVCVVGNGGELSTFGTHVLIGIGEGVITAVTVMAVAQARPDLGHRPVMCASRGAGMTRRWVFWGGVRRSHPDRRRSVSRTLPALSPDGLDAATVEGMPGRRDGRWRGDSPANALPSTPPTIAMSDSPLADYTVRGPMALDGWVGGCDRRGGQPSSVAGAAVLGDRPNESPKPNVGE